VIMFSHQEQPQRPQNSAKISCIRFLLLKLYFPNFFVPTALCAFLNKSSDRTFGSTGLTHGNGVAKV